MSDIRMTEQDKNEYTVTVTVSDENEFYKLYHYSSCDENSTQEIKESRGLIYKDNILMCKTFGFTPELLYNENGVSDMVNKCISEGYRFYPSYEGTIIRLWCDNTDKNDLKWFMSTHKKIEAGKSRWGSKYTFRELFLNTLFSDNDDKETLFNQFCGQLSSYNCYVFLLRSSSHNRIVCRRDNNEIYYLGRFDRTENFRYEYPDVSQEDNRTSQEGSGLFQEKYGVKMITDLQVKSLDNYYSVITNNTENVNDCFTTQGIMCIDKNGNTFKFVNPEYWKNSLIRGSEPNVVMRYIELKKQRDEETINSLRELYSDVQEFTYYENTIGHIKKNLLVNYIKRYINKSMAVVPPEQHRILCDLYNLYLSNPSVNKLSMEFIDNYLMNLDTPLLYNLYRQYQKRRTLYGNGNWVNKEVKDKTLSSYYKEEVVETTV